MRDETVARNYSATLLELAERHDPGDGPVAFGGLIGELAALLDENGALRLFLETPRVDAAKKKEVVREAFGSRVPKPFLHFLLVVIDKRRQRLLREIAREYHALLDEKLGRAHVEVMVARPLDDATTAKIAEALSGLLDKEVIPHIRVRPEILGGIVVRSGDTIYDGSLRRRLEGMRRQLLHTDLPGPGHDGPHEMR